MEEQDRSRWDAALVDEGAGTCAGPRQRTAAGPVPAAGRDRRLPRDRAGRRGDRLGRHRRLYDGLLVAQPSPVVALNRAIAVGFRDGFDAGLAELAALDVSAAPRPTTSCPPPGPTSSAGWAATTRHATSTSLRSASCRRTRPRRGCSGAASTSWTARASAAVVVGDVRAASGAGAPCAGTAGGVRRAARSTPMTAPMSHSAKATDAITPLQKPDRHSTACSAGP